MLNRKDIAKFEQCCHVYMLPCVHTVLHDCHLAYKLRLYKVQRNGYG